MSWSGFKKNVGRATTQVMVKTGRVEKTVNRDYEVEERRYRTLESASLRLQKEAKGYLDSLRAMTASQMRIAETIDAFYGESGAQDGVSRSYKQAVEDLDAETVKALDGPYRCVRRDSFLTVVPFDKEEGLPIAVDWERIEEEWNFKAGNQRRLTRGVREREAESMKLIEFVYRTTVLEPINRFCAYFPDINECIKKRNHKMLDYDSMRSKVKKLTEKPDKDPGKLPRTEKEADMVIAPFLLFQDIPSPPAKEEDLLPFASPPKVLDNIRRKPVWTAEVDAEEDAAIRSVGANNLRRSSSLYRNVSRVSSLVGNALTRNSSLSSSGSPKEDLVLLPPPSPPVREISGNRKSPRSSGGFNMPPVRKPVRITSPGSPSTMKKTRNQDVNKDSPTRPARRPLPPARDNTPSRESPASSMYRAALEKDNISITPSISITPAARKQASALKSTAFFHPSELEDIMAPLKKEFVEKQADLCLQAKAAYEQLNQQLTDELPQLIDLRVPYLDPTFEALVKIQLRFCAEAYSRMAQVQQYLDAGTRDSYASGDLDARVEDVLGQIRELSIAGTV